jgi:hypothetical protein
MLDAECTPQLLPHANSIEIPRSKLEDGLSILNISPSDLMERLIGLTTLSSEEMPFAAQARRVQRFLS